MSALSDALEEAYHNPDAPQPLCDGYADVYVDYDEDHIPNEEEAEELCIECPLYAICRQTALKEKPGWGVQGGIAWAYGRQVHWLEKLGIPIDPGSSPSA